VTRIFRYDAIIGTSYVVCEAFNTRRYTMKQSSSCCKDAPILPEGKLDARVPQNEIGRVYDKLSKVYDIWGKGTESRARNRAIELAAIKDGQNILEVAVGTGLAFYEIVMRNPHGQNTGIDLSKGMLERAKNRLKNLTGAKYSLAIGTAFDLPAPTGSVDLLLNNYMFDLIPYHDMDRVLSEFGRVLKKGGKLVLVNMTESETLSSRLGGALYYLIYKLSPKSMGGCRGVRLEDKLKQHGFTVETREYHQQMLFPSEVILAHKHD
jgi:ubiquinone/menaquinone biosynthesis C-methylase UbiE